MDRMLKWLLILWATATVAAPPTTTTTTTTLPPAMTLQNPVGWTDADIVAAADALVAIAPNDLRQLALWYTRLICADRATQRAVLIAALTAARDRANGQAGKVVADAARAAADQQATSGSLQALVPAVGRLP